MAIYYLIRHGEAQWDIARKRNLIGWGNDFVPLTQNGTKQIEIASELLRVQKPQVVLSSSMTRALQSATILSHKLHLPLKIEFDLHEWIPDTNFQWSGPDAVLDSFSDQARCAGEWRDKNVGTNV